EGELLLELEELLVGAREEEVREVARERKPESLDLVLQPRVEPVYAPHPHMLKRVVTRGDEHVQAEHGLDHRRVGECDGFALLFGEDEPDRHVWTLARRARSARTSSRNCESATAQVRLATCCSSAATGSRPPRPRRG